MHFYFAYTILIVSFLSHAQELDKYKIATQEQYDARYVADSETKILFAQAQYKLKKNPRDEHALGTLQLLSNEKKPYIPAVRQLVVNQLTHGNTDEALQLASVGQKYGDLGCLYLKACLLLKGADEVPALAEQDPFSLEISGRQLLEQAQQTIVLQSVTKSLRFHLPCARQLHSQISKDHERLFDAAEKSMQKSSEQEIELLEAGNPSFLQSCYLLKRYGMQDSSVSTKEAVAQVLSLAENMIETSDFNYETFYYSQAYHAVERIAFDVQNPEHQRASFLLGLIDSQRMGQDQTVDVSKVERHLEVATHYDKRALLMLAHYAKEPADQLAYLDQLSKSLDQVNQKDHRLVFQTMVQQYHELMQKGHTNFTYGLVKLLKSNLYKELEGKLCQDSDAAGQLGVQLLELYDTAEKNAATKNRADFRKILGAGRALCIASSQQGNLKAAWALVDYEKNDQRASSYLDVALDLTLQKVRSGQSLEMSRSRLEFTLEQLSPQEVSHTGAHALAHLYLVKDGIVSYNEARALPFMRKAQEGAHAAQTAFVFSDPEVCFNAAVVLHTNTRLDEHKKELLPDVNQRNNLFEHAINHGDRELRKKIVNYCLKYQGVLQNGLNAFALYCDEYMKASAETKKIEFPFFSTAMSTVTRWAMGRINSEVPIVDHRQPKAIMFLYQCTKRPGYLNEEQSAVVRDLVEWAAFARHDRYALDVLEVEFESVPQDATQASRAVLFWNGWLKAYESDLKDTDRLHQVYRKIDVLSAHSLARTKDGLPFNTNCRTHYYLANMLMEGNPEKAAEHIMIGETCMKNALHETREAQDLIKKIGTLELIEAASKAGKEWAHYSLAGIKLHRIDTFISTHSNDTDACFAEIEKIRDLLRKSTAYAQTLKDQYVLTLAEADYTESYVAEKLILSLGQNPQLATRAKNALEAAMASGYADAFYTWADNALAGDYGIGQEVLETAISRLCIAVEKGNKEAGYVLRDIHRQGFDYLNKCAGVITKELREKVTATMNVISLKEAVDVPVQDTVAYGRYLLNRLENVEQAREIFQKASDQGDVVAQVYLGVMLRDGIGGPQSQQSAQECFIRAMRESARLEMTVERMRALNIAHEALRSLAATNLAVFMDRCRYSIDLLTSKYFDLSFPLIMAEVEAIEKKLTESKEPQMNNMIYTSGIMQSLVNVCGSTKSVKHCMRVARMCAHRCLKVDSSALIATMEDAQKKDKKSEFALLTFPFAYLTDLLAEATLGMENRAEAFQSVESQEVEEMINLLEQMISLGYLEPFQRLLGSLKVCWGMMSHNKKLAAEGVANWEHAEKNGDLQAGYMWALIKLRGEQMGPVQLIKNAKDQVVGKKSFFNTDAKAGVAKLQLLAHNGHSTAMGLLGQWYLQNDNPEAALPCYRKMITCQPENSKWAVGFLEALSKTKSTEQDRKLVCSAVATTQNSTRDRALGGIVASYLRLIRGVDGISDEQALDYIIDNAASFISVSESNKSLVSFFKDTEYPKKIINWVTKLETQKEPVAQQLLAKAYLAQLYILFLNTQHKERSERANGQIIEACDKLLKIKPRSVEAESIKAIAYYSSGVGGDKDKIPLMKLSVMKCCKILTEQNLKLDSAPALNILLELIQGQGASPDIACEAGVLIGTGTNMITFNNDLQWAKAIAAKFAVKK